jgi:hypothetical protein
MWCPLRAECAFVRREPSLVIHLCAPICKTPTQEIAWNDAATPRSEMSQRRQFVADRNSGNQIAEKRRAVRHG